MSSSGSSSDSLPFATLIHMITVKLTAANYLLWKNQITSLLSCQDLLGYIDGTTPAPPSEIVTDGKAAPNPAFVAWSLQDKKLKSLLLSSLTEESMAVVIDCSTSRAVWLALATAFSHASKSREVSLKDTLFAMKKGTDSVLDFGRRFKAVCDQLSAIGRGIDETDKAHWFLRGLGPTFSAFSASQIALVPLPTFAELLPRAESFSLFLNSLENPAPVPAAAFVANPVRYGQPNGFRGRGRGNPTGQGRGRGTPKRIPRCQICRTEGHYADKCDKRFVRDGAPTTKLAEALTASCNITETNPSDWYLDTGASAHMTPSSASLESYAPYSGSERVVVASAKQGNSSKGQA